MSAATAVVGLAITAPNLSLCADAVMLGAVESVHRVRLAQRVATRGGAMEGRTAFAVVMIIASKTMSATDSIVGTAAVTTALIGQTAARPKSAQQ